MLVADRLERADVLEAEGLVQPVEPVEARSPMTATMRRKSRASQAPISAESSARPTPLPCAAGAT